MSRPVQDTYSAGPIAATTAPFVLQGGKYGIDHIAAAAHSVTLQKLAADGATYVTATTAFTANGYISIDLPGGAYRLLVGSGTVIYVTITRIQVD